MRRWRPALLAFVFVAAASGPAVADTYRYDAQGRLRCVTYANGVMAIYSYDAAGNRAQVTIGAGLTCPA